jgi:hypothetical protein
VHRLVFDFLSLFLFGFRMIWCHRFFGKGHVCVGFFFRVVFCRRKKFSSRDLQRWNGILHSFFFFFQCVFLSFSILFSLLPLDASWMWSVSILEYSLQNFLNRSKAAHQLG